MSETGVQLADITPNVNSGPKGVAEEIRRLHLKYPEMSQADIARRVDCHPTNVYRVIQRFMGDNSSESDLREYQENKADIFDALQRRILGSITDSDIVKAPLMARVTASAILEDKARVIRGQATGINVTVIHDAIAAIRERDARRASLPASIDAKV
jgi:hypothetical protein